MSSRIPYEAYFDFDNTISEFDVLDDIIQRFSINDEWKAVEEAWSSGKIGSKECLERQFSQVRVSPGVFSEYLKTLRIDPSFREILSLLRSNGVEPVIVSDSFSSIIGPVLENNGVHGLKLLCNEMTFEGDRPVVRFPYFHAICTKCGNCKTSHLMQRSRDPLTKKIYVGDGQSDVCPAGFCEILFAKGSLLRHYSSLRNDCIPFETLAPVLDHLKTLFS